MNHPPTAVGVICDFEAKFVISDADRGWFPIFRFYGPLHPLYDQSWKLNDMEELN
jgi:hypothetical protein